MDKSTLPKYLSDQELLNFLMATSFFGQLSPTALQVLIKKFEVVTINSGGTLIKQGDPGDCLYLVIRGRLRTIKLEKVDDKPTILNEIGRGELIGELALLTHTPRAATIIAMRDSVLLKLPAHAFEDFIQTNPLQIMPIVRAAISRITHHKKEHGNRVTNVMIAPAGDDQDSYRQFAQQFATELAKYGTTLHLNQQKIDEILSTESFAHQMNDLEKKHVLLKWLSQQEAQYHYIVYEADAHYSSWTSTCLRESDRILLVARSNASQTLSNLESEIFSRHASDRKLLNLVLIHSTSDIMPSGTEDWLRQRQIDHTYHIKDQSLNDLHRVIRIITDRAIGLVLGGGGARGLTYLGLYKALYEMKIPIDWIGGTSIGAIIGAGIAMGWPPDEAIEATYKYIIKNKKLFTYTLPLVSLNSGEALTKALFYGFGEKTCIEDLWINYFCVACNLTKGQQEVIQTGTVWEGLRASSSLPVIFPPITNAHGDVLIDGGMLNNLPVDVMRRYVDTIIAITAPPRDIGNVHLPDGILSGWRVLYDRLFKKNRPQYPSIYTFILNTINVSSIEHEKRMIKQADLGIIINAKGVNLLDFRALDQLMQIGYYTTMEKLANFKIPHYLP